MSVAAQLLVAAGVAIGVLGGVVAVGSWLDRRRDE